MDYETLGIEFDVQLVQIFVWKTEILFTDRISLSFPNFETRSMISIFSDRECQRPQKIDDSCASLKIIK